MEIKRNDVVYYARIQPTLSVYEVCELIVRHVDESWFSARDKRDKRVYTLSKTYINKTVFYNRNDALKIVNNAEMNKPKVTFTKDGEDE